MTGDVRKLIAGIGLVLLLTVSNGFAGGGTFVLGGYMDATFTAYEAGVKPSSFDMFHFNPIFLYQIQDNLLASAELEFEHGGSEIVLEYAQIDYLWNDYVTVTAGKFLVPIGAFNRRLHPGWISKVPGKPYSNNHIIPTGWGEIGVMLSGAVGFGERGGRVNYAAYIGDGLEGAPGADTRDLRKEGDPRDENTSNKGIGGRLGIVPVAGVEFGVSGYTADYSTDPDSTLDISFISIDGEYHYQDLFELRGEYNHVKQDTAVALDVTKKGFYIQAALKLSIFDEDILMPMELAMRYSVQDFPGDSQDLTEVSPTFNYYLSTTTIFRLSYTFFGEDVGDKANNRFMAVLAMGL